MIITCPNCQTKYQLAEKAIGSAGRKVQCAHCRESWLAHPDFGPELEVAKPKLVVSNAGPETEQDDDSLFGDAGEAELDKAFETEAADVDLSGGAGKRQSLWGKEPAHAPPAADADEPADEKADQTADQTADDLEEGDPHEHQKRQKALQKRVALLADRLPLARVRRSARMAALIAVIVVFGGGAWFRNDVVTLFPDLGGLYEAVGLKVNVIGLEFGAVKTLRTPREGRDVMIVSAKIRNVAGHNVAVPPVLVSILGEKGETLYQWTARPPAPYLAPGESVGFETQLNAAPKAAASVRLVFAESSATTSGNQEQQKQGGTGK